MITGIVVALPDEISTLSRQKLKKGDCLFLSDNVLLTCSGAGPENAEKASQRLIDKGAKRLISWGCAAALSTGLKPGDLVLPSTLLTEEKISLSIGSPWFDRVSEHLSTLSPVIGTLIESASVVANSTDKKIIYAQSNAIALDMESLAVAKIAAHHHLPVLVIRCIADPVSMDLPLAVSYALNKQGDVVLGKLLYFLLTHPNELPRLIKLGLHFKAAKDTLKSVAKHLNDIASFDPKIVSE